MDTIDTIIVKVYPSNSQIHVRYRCNNYFCCQMFTIDTDYDGEFTKNEVMEDAISTRDRIISYFNEVVGMELSQDEILYIKEKCEEGIKQSRGYNNLDN